MSKNYVAYAWQRGSHNGRWGITYFTVHISSSTRIKIIRLRLGGLLLYIFHIGPHWTWPISLTRLAYLHFYIYGSLHNIRYVLKPEPNPLSRLGTLYFLFIRPLTWLSECERLPDIFLDRRPLHPNGCSVWKFGGDEVEILLAHFLRSTSFLILFVYSVIPFSKSDSSPNLDLLRVLNSP